jgi:cyclic pyranopterin phosphate synthase
MPTATSGLVDRFGRRVTYLRLSVTDRCDLRCTYCMSESMRFLPRGEVLSYEELDRLTALFIALGVRKLRVTGGEPLVRPAIMTLFEQLSRHLAAGALGELTLTTNGTQLARHAGTLAGLGVRRVNVSLDTLDAETYRRLTRLGRIDKVLDGIEAALAAGLEVKLNAVALRGAFERDVDELIAFAHARGMDLTLIEQMPLGLTGFNREAAHLPLHELRDALGQRWTLTPIAHATGGPARFVRVEETGGRLGFITPLSCDFCASCNRVRLSATGQLFTCMGHEGAVDLRAPLRAGASATELERLIRGAVLAKPEGHDFAIAPRASRGIERTMSVLGG